MVADGVCLAASVAEPVFQGGPRSTAAPRTLGSRDERGTASRARPEQADGEGGHGALEVVVC